MAQQQNINKQKKGGLGLCNYCPSLVKDDTERKNRMAAINHINKPKKESFDHSLNLFIHIGKKI